jgi:hypothetical protein
MKKQITIKYWWKCKRLQKIPKKLQEALEDTAIEQIIYGWQEGARSGELADKVYMDIPNTKTPADGFSCYGRFYIK